MAIELANHIYRVGGVFGDADDGKIVRTIHPYVFVGVLKMLGNIEVQRLFGFITHTHQPNL